MKPSGWRAMTRDRLLEKGIQEYIGTRWKLRNVTDGSASLTIRYLHMTNKGETVIGTGTGTQAIPNQRGIARTTAEGTMWTSAPRLSNLNGGRWKVEGEVNTIKETVEVMGNFDIANI